MTNPLHDIIGRHCRPLRPIPTGCQLVLRKLPGVRAVLFDIYGTLLISGCGDIATSNTVSGSQAFADAMRASGVDCRDQAATGAQSLTDEIAADHARARRAGVAYPEVDIVEIWRRTLAGLAESAVDDSGRALTGQGAASRGPDVDLQRLALEYELRVNPVWPMPHARGCLEQLHGAGLTLGVISNAQFFTIPLWRSLLQGDADGFEIDEELQYYSYVHGCAKPGEEMYRAAAGALARRGISADQVLYVGNDMLNDVMPAQGVGFRTALFAGDARSLRRRENDPRVADVTPDLVIADLSDLPQFVC